ncbi:MAG: GH1 family beta-glucosidase [Chromatiaceae bacterium]
MTAPTFPPDFLWGAATSAYQIEGSPLADGAGPSIWHRFSHNPGRVANGETGDLACDHYRRVSQDLELMGRLGLQAYRFSIAWGRVLPDGRGTARSAGLDFYERLVDGLLERGIQPMVTLYHWDLPAALQDRGGWLSPDSPSWFADYAALLFSTLGDRVPLWVTLNEPWVVTVLGHLTGDHAPGHQDLFEAPRVAHHLLLAHAEAVAAYRAIARGRIGIAVNLEPQHPATPADAVAAARRDIFVNRWFLDPLFLGTYPQEMESIFGAAWPDPPERELQRIRSPGDFLGVNYYSRGLVQSDPSAHPLGAARIVPERAPLTAMDWEVYPEGLTEILVWLKNRYGNLPLYVTENGAAFDDPGPLDGEVPDADRVAYLRAHLLAARDAVAQGVDLRGYFVWSLLDNFEWAQGYDKRFGLVQVDPLTRNRTPKRSARFYSDVIQTNGESLS